MTLSTRPGAAAPPPSPLSSPAWAAVLAAQPASSAAGAHAEPSGTITAADGTWLVPAKSGTAPLDSGCSDGGGSDGGGTEGGGVVITDVAGVNAGGAAGEGREFEAVAAAGTEEALCDGLGTEEALCDGPSTGGET